MKTGLVVIINDLDKKDKIEALPIVFDNQESIDIYCERRLNPLVTKIVTISKVEVPDNYNFFSWTRKELDEELKDNAEKMEAFRKSKLKKLF